MSPTGYFRLFVLCLWLLDRGINCEDTQKGYVLRVQAGQTPEGVHNDERNYKRWSELPVVRIPTAGFKTSSVARGQSGSQPAQEDHTTDSTSSQIQSRYPYAVYRNVPKSQVNLLKKGFNSATVAQGRSAGVYDRSGTEAFAFPEGKKIHQANSDSVFSTGAVQVPPHIFHLSRTKLTGGFSPRVEKAPVGFGPSRGAPIHSHGSTESPDIQAIKSSLKSESHKMHINPSRPNIFSIHPHGSHLPSRPEVSGNPGSNSAGKGKTPTWSPRMFSSDVMSEARGYAQVRHIKPSIDKTQPQASSAAGRKFLEKGFPSVKQNQGRYSHDSTKLGFGLGVPASSERRLNLNYGTRGKQPSSWHPPPPDRALSHVQGKFKPFQRLPTIDLPPHNLSSDEETAPTQTSYITSSVVPSVDGELSTKSASPMQTESQDGELSTKSASPMQTESQDAKLVPQTSNHDDQSESSAEVGPALEKNEQVTVIPLTVQPAQKEGEGDTVVSSPLEKDQSEV
ncbi:uncharacterized protein [Pagrus major]|uniref:uncharacterized protein n=1 Tax=Pagrus major TaxID=143350 RepID=UPI003CC89BEC